MKNQSRIFQDWTSCNCNTNLSLNLYFAHIMKQFGVNQQWWNSVKMRYIKTILTLNLLFSSARSWTSPNPRFISEITDFFTRNGITYYFPDRERSKIHQYFKEFEKWVNFWPQASTMKRRQNWPFALLCSNNNALWHFFRFNLEKNDDKVYPTRFIYQSGNATLKVSEEDFNIFIINDENLRFR